MWSDNEDYLEESYWRPRDPAFNEVWQVSRNYSVGRPTPFEGQRKAYTYGASHESLRPFIPTEVYEGALKPKVRVRKPKPPRKKYVPTPRHAPFKLEPAYHKPVLDLAPPSKPQPKPQPRGRTGSFDDLEELLNESTPSNRRNPHDRD